MIYVTFKPLSAAVAAAAVVVVAVASVAAAAALVYMAALSSVAAAALGYMAAAAALDTGFCHFIGSISIFNLLSSIILIRDSLIDFVSCDFNFKTLVTFALLLSC